MKKIIINGFTIVMIFCILLSTSVSCSKAIDNQQTEDSVQTNKKGWWAALVAAVIVIIECTEGQYTETTTIHPDGSQTIVKSCKGWGHCAINSKSIEDNGVEVFLSSTQYEDGIDLICEGILALNEEGRIIYCMEKNDNNFEAFNNFFYDSKITISRPWIIDNFDVLKKLNCFEKIEIQGEYKVYSFDNKDGCVCKYIVLK